MVFNPNPADRHWGGGRFDSTADDPFPFLYAGSDDECAICESLLRDVPLDSSGGRFLPRKSIAGRRLSWIRSTADISVVSLRSGKDLARLGQGDNWLTSAPSRDYAFTRRWAAAIRTWLPRAQGLVWPSRRDSEKSAYVFFGDRFSKPSPFIEVTSGVALEPDERRLDKEPGLSYLAEVLARYQVVIRS